MDHMNYEYEDSAGLHYLFWEACLCNRLKEAAEQL